MPIDLLLARMIIMEAVDMRRLTLISCACDWLFTWGTEVLKFSCSVIHDWTSQNKYLLWSRDGCWKHGFYIVFMFDCVSGIFFLRLALKCIVRAKSFTESTMRLWPFLFSFMWSGIKKLLNKRVTSFFIFNCYWWLICWSNAMEKQETNKIANRA